MTDTYLGNRNLKRAAVPINWDAETILEYKKCSKDYIHFIKTYCKIVNVDRGLVNFELWPFQEEMVTKFEDNRFVICKMPRQVGKTTTVAAYLLYKVLFNPNFSIAILANKDRQAREILSRIQLMFEHLPKWLQQGVVEWNKGNIELENGSKILSAATSSSAIRGGSFNLLYLDEFAFVPNNIQEEFFASVYPTISSGQSTKVLITSTPNGMNMFYKIWTDSENGKNHYARVSVHWSMIPGRDEKWQKMTIDNTSARQFRQEYECEFLGSSNTLIDASKLSQIPYMDPILVSGDVDMYEDVEENHVYLITVDTSRGSGIDYSAFIVFDITSIPYKIVAKYRNNEIESLVYPTIIYNLARHYNDAYVLVETNDVGQQVADILQHDLEYEHVLSTKVKGRNGQKVGGTLGGFRYTIGVRTTTSVKRIGCANFKSLVENDKLIINDYDLLYEMFRFVEHNAKYSAEEGEHDDLVMCCVLFSWLVHQEYFRLLSDNDARLEVLDQNRQLIDDNVSPFGFIDDVWRSPEEDEFAEKFNKWFL
jgi:Terminase large subunit, T4likevirus-type, N-terminal/Terminase RNaseH-like domain